MTNNELVELNDEHFQKILKHAGIVAEVMKGDEERRKLSAQNLHLRFSDSGISFISVNAETPQIGMYRENGKSPVKNFTPDALKEEINKPLFAEKPKRPTPEKELQSFLIRMSPFTNESGTYMRRMVEIEECVAKKIGSRSKIYFITDELAVMRNHTAKKTVCDILAMRVDEEGTCIPMLIELKTKRLKKRLIGQIESYSEAFEELEKHLQGFSKMYSLLSGKTVEFAGRKPEPWIIWPFSKRDMPSKVIGENINVIGYSVVDQGYSFQ